MTRWHAQYIKDDVNARAVRDLLSRNLGGKELVKVPCRESALRCPRYGRVHPSVEHLVFGPNLLAIGRRVRAQVNPIITRVHGTGLVKLSQ